MSTQIPRHILDQEESPRVRFEREDDAPVRGTPIPRMRAESEEGREGKEGKDWTAKIAIVIAILALLLAMYTFSKVREFTTTNKLAGRGESNPYFAAVTRT